MHFSSSNDEKSLYAKIIACTNQSDSCQNETQHSLNGFMISANSSDSHISQAYFFDEKSGKKNQTNVGFTLGIDEDNINVSLDRVYGCRRVVIRIDSLNEKNGTSAQLPEISCWNMKCTTYFTHHSNVISERYIAERAIQNQGLEVFWIDLIQLPRSMMASNSLRIIIEEDLDLVMLRETLSSLKISITIIPNAGYGDILTGLIFQAMFLRVVGLNSRICENISIVVKDNEGADAVRRSQLKGIEDFIKVMETVDSSTSLYRIDTKPSTNIFSASQSLHHSAATFQSSLTNWNKDVNNIHILGITSDYEVLINALEEQLDTSTDIPFGARLYDKFHNMFTKHYFFDLSQRPKSITLPDDYVLCHVRLGDLAHFDIDGLDLVPHILNHYRHGYDDWLEQITASGKHSYTPECIYALADSLFPGKPKVLVTDGYQHAFDILSSPLNIEWISNKLQLSIESVTDLIRDEYHRKTAMLQQVAKDLFGENSIMGTSPDANHHTVYAMAQCDVCISSSGHFSFSVMNYLSLKDQLLYFNMEGPRFKVKRTNLETRNLPPVSNLYP
jgi:hypothetical protein